MTGRERLLTALSNQKPDHLPCQVHDWMQYFLDTYLDGRDQYEAYDYFDMDPVIYVSPEYRYASNAFDSWQEEIRDFGVQPDGVRMWEHHITTPGGVLVRRCAGNQFTQWDTKHLISNPDDFELFERYYPRPIEVDWSPVIEAKKKIGNRGIVRGSFYDFGQGSPWQSFSTILYGTEKAILACFDDPDWVHHVMEVLLSRKLEVIELAGKQEYDLVECGGGGGSSTVISPDLHRKFCLPYDIRQIEALHAQGTKVVYHLCGGLMPLLETVCENGADALETMTPPEMGGDCDLAQATRRVGDRIAFIGGFDQNRGLEKGNPKVIREMVHQLHESCPNGGYICCPSDHFFFGSKENVKAFVEACRECVY